MTSKLTATPTLYKTPTEVRNVAVDFSGKLDRNEYLTGTPTVTVSPSGPTIASAAVTTQPRVILDTQVEPGRAVTFQVSGGTAGTTYSLLVSCSASGGQTLEGYVTLVVASS